MSASTRSDPSQVCEGVTCLLAATFVADARINRENVVLLFLRFCGTG